MRALTFAILAALCAQTAQAASTPTLIKSAIFIEKSKLDGRPGIRRIEPASTLGAGDRIVTILDWRAPSGQQASTVSLVMPRHLTYQRSSTGNEEVSADGGRSWGKIGLLRVHDGDGTRLALPEDVTHVRWRVRGGNGRITYSAVVR